MSTPHLNKNPLKNKHPRKIMFSPLKTIKSSLLFASTGNTILTNLRETHTLETLAMPQQCFKQVGLKRTF